MKSKIKIRHLVIGILIVLFDQLSKYYLINKNISVISNVLDFTYTENYAAAFGIGNLSAVTILSSVLIICFIAYFIAFRKSINFIMPYILVIFGSISNLLDRLIRGYVIDFIDLKFIMFPNFNIADICIVVGAFLLIISLFIKEKKMDIIVLASNNKHKIKEFKEILKDKEILSLKDIGFNQEIDENGKTFEENSLIKAKTIHDYLKSQGKDYIVIADDSGLCVDSLGGEPGIYSARYAGEHGNEVKNRAKLQEELKGKDRKAYFNCTIVVYYPDDKYKVFEGKTYGTIIEEELGSKEFGYDCIFKSDDLNKTFGEATEEEKNSVSHRGRAIEKMLKEL